MEEKFRYYLVVLLICCIQVTNAQEKESIYILFDKSKGDTCWVINKTDVGFALKDHEKLDVNTKHKLNYFIFKPANKKEEIKYSQVKSRLISGLEAVEKVDTYLKKASSNRFKTPYYYNSYFDKVYIYEKIDEERGNLYEVTWQWYVE